MDSRQMFDGRLKMRHLVLVDVLTAEGSVMAAAARLHVAQPSATRALRELETIVGVELYERGPRGVTPTVYGLSFTEHARSILGQVVSARRHLSELAEAQRGTVTVGTHLAGSNVLLPHAIARLKTAHPQLAVSVREATPGTLVEELVAGHLDLIVGRITEPGEHKGRRRP